LEQVESADDSDKVLGPDQCNLEVKVERTLARINPKVQLRRTKKTKEQKEQAAKVTMSRSARELSDGRQWEKARHSAPAAVENKKNETPEEEDIKVAWTGSQAQVRSSLPMESFEFEF